MNPRNEKTSARMDRAVEQKEQEVTAVATNNVAETTVEEDSIPDVSVPAETVQDKSVRQQRLTKAYNAANGRLRDAHVEEFNGYYQEEAAKLGEKWEPKLTPAQKAAKELERLLAEHPHLREKLNKTD